MIYEFLKFLILQVSLSQRQGYLKSLTGFFLDTQDLILSQAIYSLQFLDEADLVQNISSIDFLILVTNSPDLIFQIKLIAEVHELPTLISGKGINTKWVFFTEPTLDCYKTCLSSFLKWLKMDDFGMIYSNGAENIETAMFIQSEFPFSISSSVELGGSGDKLEKLLGKYFKSRGVKEFLILHEDDNCLNLLMSFKSLNLEKRWNLLVVGDKCLFKMQTTGTLALAYDEVPFYPVEHVYHFNSIYRFTGRIQNKAIDRHQIREAFEKVKISCKYSILNYQNNSFVKVGEIINGTVRVTDNILFFSKNNSRIKVNLVPITISAETDEVLGDSLFDQKQNSLYHQGTKFMLNYLQETRTSLKNFQLQLFSNFQCKDVDITSTSARCLSKNLENLGVALIPSFYYSSMKTTSQLRSLGSAIPVVNGMGTTLKSTKTPENYFRVVSALDFILHYSTKILQLFDKAKILVFYSNDRWGKMIYSHLLSLESSNLLKIMNSAKNREIPANIDSSMLFEYRENIQEALESGCYFVFFAMSHPTPFNFLEVFYDFGVRRGDFSYFFVTPTGLDALQVDKEKLLKRKELLHGSHFFYPTGWTEKLEKEFKEKFEMSGFDAWLPSFYMDAVFAVVKGIELVNDLGLDYENHEILARVINSLKFEGVTGMVMFNQEDQSREFSSISVYNLYEDSVTKEFMIKETGKISPMTSNYFKIDQSVWPFGEKRAISMKTFYLNCEIFQYRVEENTSSIFIETLINLSVLISSGLIALVYIFKYKISSIPMLTSVKFIEPDDYLEIISILLEPFQMISLGPSMIEINPRFGKILHLLSLNWLQVFQIRDQNYWILLYFSISFTGLCLVLLGLAEINFLRLSINKEKLRKIQSFLQVLMLNFLYFPIFSLLSSVFSCRFSEKSQNPFLDSDCSFICWKNSHFFFCVLCFTCLVTQSLVSNLYKSREADSLTKNIKSSQAFFMLKSFFAVFIQMIQKILIFRKDSRKVIFAVVFLACMVVILVFLFRNNAYNLDRINLWIKVAYFCVIWNTLMFILAFVAQIWSAWVIILDVFGWGFIVVIGFRLHHKLPPSLLVVKEGKTIKQMIKLAFDFGVLNRLQVYRNKNTDFMEKRRTRGSSIRL